MTSPVQKGFNNIHLIKLIIMQEQIRSHKIDRRIPNFINMNIAIYIINCLHLQFMQSHFFSHKPFHQVFLLTKSTSILINIHLTLLFHQLQSSPHQSTLHYILHHIRQCDMSDFCSNCLEQLRLYIQYYKKEATQDNVHLI